LNCYICKTWYTINWISNTILVCYACIKAPFILKLLDYFSYRVNVHSVSDVKNKGVYTKPLHSVRLFPGHVSHCRHGNERNIFAKMYYSQIRCSIAGNNNNITQYCNIERLIALANCNQHEQIAIFMCWQFIERSCPNVNAKHRTAMYRRYINTIIIIIWLACFVLVANQALFTNLFPNNIMNFWILQLTV
jgi:hypothetical protein